MQPVTTTGSFMLMTVSTGYSGPGPERMLRSVMAVAEMSANAAVANAMLAPRPSRTGFHMTDFLAMDPVRPGERGRVTIVPWAWTNSPSAAAGEGSRLAAAARGQPRAAALGP